MYSKTEYSRIKNILIKDKSNRNEKFNSVIKSEIYELLSNYMDVKSVECFVNLQSDGEWQIKILAGTTNFYNFKSSF